MKNMTYLPTWFGAKEYLGSNYEGTRLDNGGYDVPKEHVTYLFSGYPDAKDDYCCTNINITDPSVIVYGLSMESSFSSVCETMSNLGFYIDGKDTSFILAYKNNVTISFSKNGITLNAKSTNKSGIVY